MKHDTSLKKKAIALRKKGFSYGQIAKQLNLSKSTLSVWLKSVPLSEKYKKRFYTERICNLARGNKSARARREERAERLLENARKCVRIPLTSQEFLLFGAALYWAEGTKKGQFEITNSDPSLVVFMVDWIGRVLGVPARDLKAKLNFYAQQQEGDVKRFWSDLTGIPMCNFGKSYIKPQSKNWKKNTLYYGTIKVVVPKSSAHMYTVFGILESVMSTYAEKTKTIVYKWRSLKAVERLVNLD